MESLVLDVSNVTKAYGNRVAVNNVSFKIKEGEILGFLGPNGAGKTTTMKMICGLTSITKGTIKICGYNIEKSHTKALSNIGAIIENPIMYGDLTAMDNLKYYASLYKNVTKKDILAYARIVGLEYRLKDKVRTYSLGMRQRLGIAQALLHSPKLLILDEPFSGLDPNGVKEMRDLLRMLARQYNIAIMISSHMLSDMEQVCDNILVITNGTIIERKSMSEVINGIEGAKKIQLKTDYPNYAGKIVINELKYETNVAGNSIIVHVDESKITEITQKLIQYGLSIFGIEIITKSLEEVFLDIINRHNNGQTSIY